MNYYAEILTEFVVEKIIVGIKQQAYQQGAEFGYNKAKEELEEENAELKEQCSILADCDTCHSTCKNENIEMKKQLTKAKEIIQKLCDIVCGRSGDDQELLNRAEQFLNSEVEE